MSDFVWSGWSVFVAVTTAVSMIACLVLLAIAARRRVMTDADGKEDGTTGHVWDGDLVELNNPLPRWWMWLFILSVLFGAAYLVLYPGAGSRPGTLGWSSAGQLEAEEAAARAEMARVYAPYAGASAETLMRDRTAMGIGERLFIHHCATCHGSDARGSKGFPSLADRDWLHGGTHDIVRKTIAEGRVGVMPPMGAAVGEAREQRALAHYVLSLSGSPYDSIAAARGRSKFGLCAGCHGSNGKGNQALGAPDLTDNVWLHGWGEKAIVAMINNGKTNVMPAHAQRLSAEQIDVLAAYVMSLSARRLPASAP